LSIDRRSSLAVELSELSNRPLNRSIKKGFKQYIPKVQELSQLKMCPEAFSLFFKLSSRLKNKKNTTALTRIVETRKYDSRANPISIAAAFSILIRNGIVSKKTNL